jgi:DNA-binding ferritin-like protein (Dps family)
MGDLLNTIIGNVEGKKEWKAMERRAKELPTDYRYAYAEIKRYLWRTSGVSTINPFRVLLHLFEQGAANGKHVLEITGDDVAAFADGLVRGEKSYANDSRAKLQHDVVQRLSK